MGVIRFQHQPPDINLTMGFEAPYHPNLQYDEDEKGAMLSLPGLIGVWMSLDGELVGETYGLPGPFTEDMIVCDDETVYCYSNTVLRPSLGLGSTIKAHWLGVVVGRGFRRVIGHARPGASQALNVKFGAVLGASWPNWYGTGETYRQYELTL